jgi:hypothetical protein
LTWLWFKETGGTEHIIRISSIIRISKVENTHYKYVLEIEYVGGYSIYYLDEETIDLIIKSIAQGGYKE